MDSEKFSFAILVGLVMIVLIITFLCIGIQLVRQFLATKKRASIDDRLKQPSSTNELLFQSSTKTNSASPVKSWELIKAMDSSIVKKLPGKEDGVKTKINIK